MSWTRSHSSAKLKGVQSSRMPKTFRDSATHLRSWYVFLRWCSSDSAYTPQYETLRVFPVVLPIGRVACGTQSFKSPAANNLNSALLPNCGIVVNITGVHYNTKCWPEPEVFQPRRWLCENPNSYVPSSSSKIDLDPDVRIPSHRRGTFLTFSEGPRACLGRRFAQAEFVCFFAEVLKHHRLRLSHGVDRKGVEQLFRSCSAGSPITLAPPSDVGLMLEQR